MRPRRAIAALLVFVLLGAVATVLSSWAIHAVRFDGAPPRPMMTPSPHARFSRIVSVPQIPWPVDHERAAEYGIDPAAQRGRTIIDRQHWFGRFLDEHYPDAQSQASELRLADRSWRRHRTVASGMPPTPDYPFPFVLFEERGSRPGWRMLASVAEVSSDADLAPRHSTYEALAIFRVGWPLPALESGAHYAELVEDLSYTVEPNIVVSNNASRAVLARPPKFSLLGGVELWHAQGPPTAQSNLWQTPHNPLDRFALPLLPLWPGFLLNTLFYALLLFIAWRGPGVVRRAVRRRRGRCVGCGYDRGGLDADAACPECGAGAGARVATGPAAAT
ncbi:MAG: hypothetical protein ACIAS6_05240 [Phycisphaerales bacterium JB060]